MNPASLWGCGGSTHQQNVSADRVQVHSHDVIVRRELTRVELEGWGSLFQAAPPAGIGECGTGERVSLAGGLPGRLGECCTSWLAMHPFLLTSKPRKASLPIIPPLQH